MPEDTRDELQALQKDLESAADDGHDEANDVLDHVNAYLEHDEPEPELHHALRRRLTEAVVHFEATHPELSATLDRVVSSLTAAGI